MPANYQKLYAYLVGQVDNALTLLDEGDLVNSRPIKAILQQALWKTEAAYTDEFEENNCVCIELYSKDDEELS